MHAVFIIEHYSPYYTMPNVFYELIINIWLDLEVARTIYAVRQPIANFIPRYYLPQTRIELCASLGRTRSIIHGSFLNDADSACHRINPIKY